MDEYIGTIHTIKSITEDWFEGRLCYFMEDIQYKWDERGLELACKFKVGDKVRAKKNAPYTYTTVGWIGTVTHVGEHTFAAEGKCGSNTSNFHGLNYEHFDLVEDKQKIVITTDGKTTTATLYNGKQRIKEAKAICASTDTFDFNYGASLALERLTGQILGKVENTLEEKPKYFTGKVRCTRCKNGFLTEGKVYEFIDGRSVDDEGDELPVCGPVESLAQLNEWIWSDFEEVTEEKSQMDRFIAGEIALRVPANKMDKFLKECEKRGLRWNGGEKPTKWAPYSGWSGVIRMFHDVGALQKDRYDVEGYTFEDWESEELLNTKICVINGHDSCVFKAGHIYEIEDGTFTTVDFPICGKLRNLDDLKYYLCPCSEKDKLKHSDDLTHHCYYGVEFVEVVDD